MSIERYLVGIEQLEYALFKQVEALKSYSFDEAKTATNKRYLVLYTIGFLTYLSTVARSVIQTIKTLILAWTNGPRRAQNRSPLAKNRMAGSPGAHAPAPVHGVDAIISFLNAPERTFRHQLFHGDYLIVTSSAGLVETEGCALITIPDSSKLPPVTIRIKAVSGQVGLSKLIFQTSSKSSLSLYRRFGTDEIPVKLSENINVSTDRITLGETVSVRFSQELVRAR